MSWNQYSKWCSGTASIPDAFDDVAYVVRFVWTFDRKCRSRAVSLREHSCGFSIETDWDRPENAIPHWEQSSFWSFEWYSAWCSDHSIIFHKLSICSSWYCCGVWIWGMYRLEFVGPIVQTMYVFCQHLYSLKMSFARDTFREAEYFIFTSPTKPQMLHFSCAFHSGRAPLRMNCQRIKKIIVITIIVDVIFEADCFGLHQFDFQALIAFGGQITATFIFYLWVLADMLVRWSWKCTANSSNFTYSREQCMQINAKVFLLTWKISPNFIRAISPALHTGTKTPSKLFISFHFLMRTVILIMFTAISNIAEWNFMLLLCTIAVTCKGHKLSPNEIDRCVLKLVARQFKAYNIFILGIYRLSV